MRNYLLPAGMKWAAPWRERMRRDQEREAIEEANRQTQREREDLYLRYLSACREWPEISHEAPAVLPVRHDWVKREFNRR